MERRWFEFVERARYVSREKDDDGRKFMLTIRCFRARKGRNGPAVNAVDKNEGSEEAVGLMNHRHVLLFVFLIGVVTGLRSLTGPAVTSWAAHLGWLSLIGTPMHFMASIITVTIFTLLAVVELVADQLPSTPARTAPVGLSARVVMGGLCGATVGGCRRRVDRAWDCGGSGWSDCRYVRRILRADAVGEGAGSAGRGDRGD